MNKEEFFYFIKYLVTKPIKEFLSFANKPSNWNSLILVMFIGTVIGYLMKADFRLLEFRIPVGVIIVYIIAFASVAIYKEKVAGEWKKRYRESKRKSI